MASTGLLGFNPYQKGVNIDFSSKPAAMAVQLIQHEAAKKEALDKYYKDYENKLTSTGMRNQDTDVFLNKLGEAKQYYLQNREKILNPAKYGADAQAQYAGLLRGTQTAISQSKQLAATDKLDAEHFYQAMQKGLDVPDGYMEAAQRARLPMNHKQFQPLDPYQYNFTKPFNEAEFAKNLTAGLTPSENKQYIRPKDFNNPNSPDFGYNNVISTSAFDNKAKDVIKNKGEIAYQTIPGVTNMTNKVIKNGQVGNFQNQFNELYPGQDINNAKPPQIAAAIGLSITSHGKTATSREPDWLTRANYKDVLTKQNIGLNKAAQGAAYTGPTINLFDSIGSDEIIPIGTDKQLKDGFISDVQGNPVNGEVFIRKERLPVSLLNALSAQGTDKDLLKSSSFKGFTAIVKDGRINVLRNPKIGVIDRQGMIDAQIALDKENLKGPHQQVPTKPAGKGLGKGSGITWKK